MNPEQNKHEKIHLLHLVDGLILGGAEILITHIIRALGTKHYKHYVYYLMNDGPVREKLEASGIPVYKGKKRASIKHPLKFVATLFFQLIDLTNFIKREHIQVIHAHLGDANQLAVIISKLSGVPALLTIHSPKAFVDRRSKWDFRLHCQKVANQYIYRAANRVVVVSQEIKEIVQQRFGLKDTKILVLKNGIMFEDEHLNFNDFEKEFPLSKKKLKLIAVGRLVPLKNYDILLKAISEVINKGHNDLMLLIAGEGEERGRLERLIQDLKVRDYVKLLGLRHDILELMQTSDLFVIPSSYEGLSLAMIEAMASGLPIIASDVRGLNDYIKNEKNGLLFPVGDYKALAQRILQIANNKELRINLSQGARRSFEKEYDMRKNIKSIDILFKEYANRRQY